MSNTNNEWTNKNLKVGDRVLIDWEVCEWLEGETNPECTEGTVTALWSGTYADDGITVRWDNGKTNQYRKGDSDLVLVSPAKDAVSTQKPEGSGNYSFKIPSGESIAPTNKDSWFEKGEFPPAGTTCEVNHRCEWVEVYIIGMDGEGYCVYRLPKGKADTYGGRMFTTNFRPINGLDLEVTELKKSFPNVPEETLKDIYLACKTMLEKQE